MVFLASIFLNLIWSPYCLCTSIRVHLTMSRILANRLVKVLQGNTSPSASKTAFLSTDAPYSVISPETDPRKHTLRDAGLFYSMDNSLGLYNLFKQSVLKSKYVNECTTFGKTYFMIRKPALEIIHYLKHTDFNKPVNRYVLYGKRGHGVTMTTLHLIHFAYASEWLIINVPDVLQWLMKQTERVKSEKGNPDLLDLPLLGSAWLNHFKTQNLNVIKKFDLQLQNNYVWNIQEENKKGDSLLNLVDHGIARGKYSCDVIIGLLDEIKTHCRNGSVKCLVIIDEYGAIFRPKKESSNKKLKYLGPNQVSFMEAFKNLALPDWHNGAVVLTCGSEKYNTDLMNHYPLNKLTLKGFEFLFPFIPVEVPELTELEMMSMLDFYRSEKWLLSKEADEELKALSGGSIGTLQSLCGAL